MIYIKSTKDGDYWLTEVGFQDGPLLQALLRLTGHAKSYSRSKSIAYALEDLAAKVLKVEEK